MKNKLKFLILLAILVTSFATISAQGLSDEQLLKDAKSAYNSRNFELCLAKIDELEKRGNKGPVNLYIKIMATRAIGSEKLSYAQLEGLKKDVDFFLENYAEAGLERDYRAVKTFRGEFIILPALWEPGYKIFKQALSKYEAGDFANAMKTLLSMEKYSYKTAEREYLIGVMHHLGQGVPVNYAEALRWYKFAANMENPSLEAMSNLGYMYLNGQGVKKDLAEAFN